MKGVAAPLGVRGAVAGGEDQPLVGVSLAHLRDRRPDELAACVVVALAEDGQSCVRLESMTLGSREYAVVAGTDEVATRYLCR